MINKTLITSVLSLLMVNASMLPVLAKPTIETEKGEKQEISSNSEEQMVVLSPATPETPEAVQIVPLQAYIALKGEASLENRAILEVLPEPTASSTGNKDALKDDAKSALTQETEYFVVLPEGEELSAQEMEQVEGEVAWFVPGLIGAGTSLAFYGGNCYWRRSCTLRGAAWAAGAGAVSGYAPGGFVGRFFTNQGIRSFQPGRGIRVY